MSFSFSHKNFFIAGVISKVRSLEAIANEKLDCSQCDFIEIRYDHHWEDYKKLPQLIEKVRNKKPILLTIRTNAEGGEWKVSDEKRMKIFQNLQEYVDIIDLELESDLFLGASRKDFSQQLSIIGSYHNYNSSISLSQIESFIDRGKKWGVSLVKLALSPKNEDDFNKLQNFLIKKFSIPLCLIAMGESFSSSRVKWLFLGSKLGYAYLDFPSASGQISVLELASQINSYR